jgi:predicted HD superfamily hydrolase involved in NAD metabolism
MDSIYNYIEKNSSEHRKNHIDGVVNTADKLAVHFGVDRTKTKIAALCHDMYRGIKDDVLNIYVKQLGLPKKYLDNANLAHAKIAAEMIKKDFGIEDEDVLNAVRYHTTGRAGMSILEKVIFLADSIEPGRNYPGVDEIRQVAETDLDRACLMCLERTIDYINKKGYFLDPDTLDAREWFLKKENIHG